MTENPQPDPLEKPIDYFTLAKAFLLTGLNRFWLHGVAGSALNREKTRLAE